jgi:hypothetical protein
MTSPTVFFAQDLYLEAVPKSLAKHGFLGPYPESVAAPERAG